MLMVHEMVRDAAAAHAGRAALQRGGEAMTYAALDAGANRLAHRLIAAGVGPGVPVGLFSADPFVLVPAVLAVLRAGGVFVPLDPRLPAGRLAAMLAVVRPDLHVAAAAECGALAALLAGGGEARVVCADPEALDRRAFAGLAVDARPLSLESGADPALPADPDAVCDVFFTSGSTGTPKGIAGRLCGIGHFMQAEGELLGARPGMRYAQLTGPAFDGFLRDVFIALVTGGTVCVPGQPGLAADPRALARWLAAAGVNVMHCVPSVLRGLLAQPLEGDAFPALTHVGVAGEPLLPADVARFRAVFGGRVALLNFYGPTETTLTKLVHVVTEEDARRRTVPIGRPLPGAQAVVLDGDGLPCPPDTLGEIYLRTPYRAHGYWGRPDLTAQAFVPNPITGDADDVVYRTGDLGRMREDGAFEFAGRRDHQVKIRGVRVELAEVENALRSHPAVADAAVRDWDDGQGGRSLAAYWVFRAQAGEADAGALRAWMGRLLPEAMVPSRWVPLAALPRTPNGKLDRNALPDPARTERAREPVAPRDAVETVLAGVWAEVLGLPAVGVEDPFFEVGGHSLLLTRVAAAVEELFETELPLALFFEAATVAEQARALAARDPRPGRTLRVAELVCQVAALSADELETAAFAA
jgi:amino acid adenylation domain-containing protein